MQAGPYKIGCKLREIKILLRLRSLDFNQDKTKSVRASRLLLLMHIIDARIYADLEFEIHPSIPLINCPNNDCNWRNWRRQPIDTSRAGSIPNTLFSIRIEYLWSKLTCTKYALLLCVVVAGADVNGTPPFTHKSSGLPYPNWPWNER